MTEPDEGPITRDFRYEVVTKFVKDLSNGRIEVNINPDKWAENSQEAQKTLAFRLMSLVDEFVNPETTVERRNAIEIEMFEYIIRLRSLGSLATRPEVEEDIVERFEALKQLQMQILIVLKDILKRLPE